MKSYLTGLFLLLFSLASPLAHAGWIPAGSYGGDEVILLDDRVRPVADENKKIIPNLYTLSYKISLRGNNGYVYTNFLVDLESEKVCPLPGKTEMLTLSNRNIYQNDVDSQWRTDALGLNHLSFAAYLWKNQTKIDNGKPYLSSGEILAALKDRTPTKQVNEKGWLQVYDKSNHTKAWIQTRSIRIVQESRQSLPSLQVLVRREEQRGDQTQITYALENYYPSDHQKLIRHLWQETAGKATEKELPVKTLLPILIPNEDTAIASAAYLHDLLQNRSAKAERFSDNSIPAEWLNF
jgi:hypothetical protein